MELEFIDVSRPEQRRRHIEERRRPPKKRTASARKVDSVQRAKEIELQRQRVIRSRKRKRKRRIIKSVIVLCELGFIIILGFLVYNLLRAVILNGPDEKKDVVEAVSVHRTEMIETNNTQKPEIIEDFLTINEYSRPGEPLQNVNNLFVHYTANPETSAAQNRSYFENLGITGETSASAHFVIGYDGEIIQCIPLNEIAYAVMQRNYDSVSIECCYLQEDGKFTDATYRSLIQLCAWFLNEYDLAPEDMRRHYDEGGKKCPLYYVEHEEAWEQFINDLEKYIMEEQV